MKLKAWGYSDQSSFDKLRADPALRKATAMTLHSMAAVEDLHSQSAIQPEGLAVILTSVCGELQTTYDYLESLKTRQFARPLLFQNSLFHSTLGALSIHYKWTGPTMTLGNNHFAARAGVSLAEELLETGLCQECLLIGVDERVEEFSKAYENFRAPDSRALESGAGALLLSSSKGRSIKIQEGAPFVRDEYFLGSHEVFELSKKIDALGDNALEFAGVYVGAKFQ